MDQALVSLFYRGWPAKARAKWHWSIVIGKKAILTYPVIFWMDATSEDTVKGSCQSISERINVWADYLPDVNARVAFVLRLLTSWTARWLMVFDNYDNPDAFPNLRDLIPQSELGAILVTSSHPDSIALVLDQSNRFIELFGLKKNAAVALLIQQSQTSEGISADAKKIVGRLGCHPLAIMQAGAYIRKRKLRLCEFIGASNSTPIPTLIRDKVSLDGCQEDSPASPNRSPVIRTSKILEEYKATTQATPTSSSIVGVLFKSCADLFWLVTKQLCLLDSIKQKEKSVVRDTYGEILLLGSRGDWTRSLYHRPISGIRFSHFYSKLPKS